MKLGNLLTKFEEHDHFHLAGDFLDGVLVETDTVLRDRCIDALAEFDLADRAFEAHFEDGLEAEKLLLVELEMEVRDEVFGQKRRAFGWIVFEFLGDGENFLYPAGEGFGSEPVPAGTAFLEIEIEPVGKGRIVDILEEKLLEKSFRHADLLLVELGEEVGQELLGFEWHEQDIDLLRKEAAEGGHEHLELLVLFRFRLVLIALMVDDGTLLLVDFFLDDAPVFHVEHAIGILEVLRVMGHHDDRLLVDFVELLQDLKHVLSTFAVEVADRFIGEDDVGIIDQRAGDSDALLLSAGELAREFVGLFSDAEAAKQLVAGFEPLFRGFAAEDFRKDDVVDDIERWDEIESLENHTDESLMEFQVLLFGHLRDDFVLDGDTAIGGGLQSGE